MYVCILDGNEIHDREQLHDRLAQSLDFPEWYGKNLDALYDCLTDVREEVEIRLLHSRSFEGYMGKYVQALEKAVQAAAEMNPKVHWIEEK